MCRNVVLRVTELVEVLFYTGRGFIPSLEREGLHPDIQDKTGMSAEAIAKEYPQLNLAQIYSALAYYHANKERIEADIDAYRADCEDWESRYRAGEL